MFQRDGDVSVDTDWAGNISNNNPHIREAIKTPLYLSILTNKKIINLLIFIIMGESVVGQGSI